MNIPKDRLYTKEHEWIFVAEDGRAIIGITDFAQDSLGDIVYVETPEIGDEISAGDALATVESVKAVSEVFSPGSGMVDNINEELLDIPEIMNQKPYEAWMVKLSDFVAAKDLLSPEEYEELLNSMEE